MGKKLFNNGRKERPYPGIIKSYTDKFWVKVIIIRCFMPMKQHKTQRLMPGKPARLLGLLQEKVLFSAAPA
jgi:hypothetical protein